jgi:hypothetical protein
MTPDAERIVQCLRARAAVCRGAAAIPTNGGHGTDALLIEMARRLEREADAIEGNLP